MRRRARTDANHGDVVAALRKAGHYVLDLSRLGSGCPDLLIARRGRLVLVEVKDGSKPPSKRQLTEDEQDVHHALARCGVQVAVITSVQDAMELS